ncbi:MAG: hypothetical protein ACI4OJ_12805 [Lachnospiraceae bacterium]
MRTGSRPFDGFMDVTHFETDFAKVSSMVVAAGATRSASPGPLFAAGSFIMHSAIGLLQTSRMVSSP